MKVCVDPGHGMSNATPNVFDTGATSDGFREADVTLQYGLKLRDVLQQRGIDVFMTRSNDTDPAPVGTRARRAENAGCDKFVAFHLNASDNPQGHGLEVLYGNNSNKQFAQSMQTALVAITGFRDRGTTLRENLAVLKFDGPAVLIEVGFITNTDDRTKLMQPDMIEKVCKAVADNL